ncbi:hypothetical protein CRYUN_Cryun08bG0145800 [Craigia yunnanensis]
MQEAEEAKKQLSAMSVKLEESEQQLLEISASEDDRVQELRKISQDRDRAWQSELEAVQKQHSMDSAALASAMNEIQKLKVQLEKAYESEAIQTKHADSAHAEIQNLRIELTETLSLVDKLKSELNDCSESESQALEVVSKTQMQLEAANNTKEKTKDQLTASESWKRQAMQEAEEAKKQLSAMSVKLEESEQQLLEISASEDDRVQELRKISQDRDRAWQSELEAVQKQHSMDSAALASAMNEIQKLKVQLEKAYESEAIQTKHADSAHAENQNLRIELTETLSSVDKLKSELNDCRESESQALEVVSKTQMQLEAANNTKEKTKDQLTASESWKRQAMQEAEEAKKQLSAMSVKLEESEQQLLEISASEDDRVQELRKISQDRDRAWQSELEAVQKQHSMDSAALASAMNEIQKLKVQLEKAYESEAIQTKHADSAHAENQNLRIELTETLSSVDKLKSELNDCRESESQALEVVSKTQMQLEAANNTKEKTKDQLTASKSWKRQAMQEAEVAKKQLSAMSVKLEESERKLLEISASKDDCVQELRKISQDRDRAWQSELEAVQKQHSMDSAALASAMNEIQKLKVQLEKAYESEVIQTKHADSAHAEIQNLRIELTETLSLVDKLKSELTDCRESESQALEVVSKTQMQLEAANNTIEILRSDATKGTEAYKILSLELEQSKARVKSLEGLVSKLQAELVCNSSKIFKDPKADKLPQKNGENEEIQQLKTELNFAKLEVGQLRSALDAAEIRYQEEYSRSTLQIRSAYEQVECIRTQSYRREVELEAEVKRTKANVEELRANLVDKETELQSISEENEELNLKIEKNHSDERESELAVELKKLEADLTELKANLTAKETELRSVNEQNEMLKMEIKKKEMESNKVSDESVVLLEAARAAEREALMKLAYLTEEADKWSRRAASVTEQLDTAQAANTEMEAELRRLKVQSDQWRKAAEAAASMLSTGNYGKHADRTISLGSNYNSIIGSPNSEDMDDDSPKKKNGNMLKKIGVLWKKAQK